MLDPTLSAFLQSWELEPTILVGLTVAAGLYYRGLARLWRRRGRGAVVGPWRAVAFGAGLFAVFLALQSPIATFSGLLFSMHMTQHLLLTLIGAPLLLLGHPLLPTLWALPLPTRRALGQAFAEGTPLHGISAWLTSLVPATAIHSAAVLVWHMPQLYNLSLGYTAAHYLQHLMFLGTALLFWWAVLQPVPGRASERARQGAARDHRDRRGPGEAPRSLLTFAERPIYEHYARVPRLWGLSALIAGLIMMVGGFFWFGLVFTILFFVWAARETRETAREEALAQGSPQNPEPDSLALFREATMGSDRTAEGLRALADVSARPRQAGHGNGATGPAMSRTGDVVSPGREARVDGPS